MKGDVGAARAAGVLVGRLRRTVVYQDDFIISGADVSLLLRAERKESARDFARHVEFDHDDREERTAHSVDYSGPIGGAAMRWDSM